MHTATAFVLDETETSTDSLVRLVPGASRRLAHLSNDELLTRTRGLVGKANQVLAALLDHLGEVEARGLHREKRCASLYTYCIYELRFSEDAASRRASAARVVRQFPAALDAIARGEIHLTGLLQVAPTLTDANHLEVLAHAKFRTKKEISKLVRRIAPLPEVPDRIEALGSPLQKKLRSPSWAELVEAFAPPIRELRHNERPSDWATASENAEPELEWGTAPARESDDETASSTALARESGEEATGTKMVSGRRTALSSLEAPVSYQMQFTTTEEHVELVEKAKALLSHGAQKLSLGELHLQAMRLLVDALEKKRFGAKRAAIEASNESDTTVPRRRGRAIPAAVRRLVYEHDQGRCTFVDASGERCAETHLVQLHHLVPFANGGQHTLGNLTLPCAAHNALAAEQDFGRDFMNDKRDGERHEARKRAESG